MTFYFLALYLTIKSSLGIHLFPQPSCRRLPWVAKRLISKMFSRWWFQICLIFTPGEMIQFDWYFSKPPTSFDLCLKSCLSLKSKKLVCLFWRSDSSPGMNSYEIGYKGRMQNQTTGVSRGSRLDIFNAEECHFFQVAGAEPGVFCFRDGRRVGGLTWL